MAIFKKLYLFWFYICSVITIIFLFDLHKFLDYLNGNYHQEKMLVREISYPTSTSKRNSVTLKGYIGKDKVFLVEYDEKMKYVYEYIHSDDVYEKGKGIEKSNIKLPVIRFKSTENVLLIPKNMTSEEIIKKWSLSRYTTLIIAYFPLILFYLIYKFTKK